MTDYRFFNMSGLEYRLKCGSECHKEKNISCRKRLCKDCPYGHMDGTCDVLFAEDVALLLEYMKLKGFEFK